MSDYNTPKRKVQPIEKIDIPWYHTDFIKREGEFAEVNHFMIPPKGTIRRIDKERYEVIATGEIREYKPSMDKSHESIKKSMTRLRGIIRANFGQDINKEQHITLTYRGIMNDTDKLYSDFQAWLQRLKYRYNQHKFEYIAIIEPHSHGGFHIHLLLKSNRDMWLSFRKVRKMWHEVTGSDGYIRHERIVASDVGAYFVAYFTTAIPEDIEKSGDKEAIRKASKAAKKGSRVKFYPPYFKFYRCSRGIIRPKTEKALHGAVLAEYGQPTSVKRYEVQSEEGQAIQRIQTMSFKKSE